MRGSFCRLKLRSLGPTSESSTQSPAAVMVREAGWHQALRCDRRFRGSESRRAPHMSRNRSAWSTAANRVVQGANPCRDSSDRAAPAVYKRRCAGRGGWPSGSQHRPKGRGPIPLSPPEWARPDNSGRAAANGHALELRDQFTGGQADRRRQRVASASSVTALGVQLSFLPPYGECRRWDGNQP